MMPILFLVPLCLMQLPPRPLDSASPKFLRDELGREFRAYYSKNFEILSDADANVVHKLEGLAEDTFRAVTKWNSPAGTAPVSPSRSMAIVLFRADGEFTKFLKSAGLDARPDIPGYYDERRDLCVILDVSGMEAIRRKRDELFVARREMRTNTQESGSRAAARQHRMEQIRSVEAQINEFENAINATVVRHEIAHMVLAQLGLQRRDDMHRRWLKEGLAMQFENPDGINAYRLADFQAIPNADRKHLLRDMIRDSAIVGPGSNQAAQAYALAWALVQYLSKTRSDLFRQYMLKPDSSNGSELDQFEKRFGEIDDEFVRQLSEYTRSLAS